LSVSDFNLLASTHKRDESRGCAELWMLLKDLGDNKPVVDKSGVHGIILAKTGFNQFEVITKLREELRKRPEAFQHLIRIMPIETVVRSELSAINEAAQTLSSKIEQQSSFRITIEKRRTILRSLEIIEAIAQGIDRKVDLENPDWIVLIEVIGRYTGISVIKPTDMLHTVKERVTTDEHPEEHNAQ